MRWFGVFWGGLGCFHGPVLGNCPTQVETTGGKFYDRVHVVQPEIHCLQA